MRGTPLIPSFLAGETSPLTAGRVDLDGYLSACDLLQNMIVRVHGPAEKRPGTRFVAAADDEDNPVRLIPFAYSAADNYILELGEYYMRFYTQGGIVMSGPTPLKVTTPWAADELGLLKFVQSADVMYFVHPLYPPYKLVRSGPTSWTLAAVGFAWGPFLEENSGATTITPSGTTGNITLTASASLFQSSHVGARWRLTADYVVSGTIAALAGTVGNMALNASERMIVSLSGTWSGTIQLQRSYDGGGTWLAYVAFAANTSTEIENLEDGVLYRLYASAWTSGTATGRLVQRDRSGYVAVTGYTSATAVSATVVSALASTAATAKWAEGAFSALRGYPMAIGFYEQRLILAGTSHRPSTVWGSYVDDYESFEAGPTDAHAYSYTLAGSRVNDILWLSPQKVLFIGTIGDEWKFGFADDPTTNANVDAKKESEHGSAPIQPLVVEGSPVFVEAGGKALRAVVYSLDEDAFRAPRISEHAEHLLREGLLDLAFAQQPTPTIWGVRADGLLVACTFSRSGKTAAFSRHDFGGEVESAAVARSADRDELWLAVRRYVDGAWRRYVECMETGEWSDVEEAFYVDCGLTYQGAPAQSLAGLDHLEGEEVNVLADGAVHRPLTVTGGGITLDYAAATVHAGLAYQAVLKTKQIEPRAASGSVQGKPKQIFKVYVRFDRSFTCRVGYDESRLLPIVFRTTATPLGSPPPPFTGDKEIHMMDRGTDAARIVVANSDPVPFTVVSVSATMHASEL